MSTAQNKEVVRQLIEEVINQNNLSLAEEIMAADIIEHEEPPPVSHLALKGTKYYSPCCTAPSRTLTQRSTI